MGSFAEIEERAEKRKGGAAALKTLMPKLPDRDVLRAQPDDRLLSEMTRYVFYAGFVRNVIDSKWPGFEAAFSGFDPAFLNLAPDDYWHDLTSDTRIVRNGAKIRSVQLNAKFLLDLAAEHGSAARFFAAWPDSDYVGLLAVLKDRASHLGGDAGMRFLRAIGKPAFVTTPDVVAALIREGVLARPPGGKRDLAAVQDAFNRWSAQSGRDLTQISRILAMSVEGGGH